MRANSSELITRFKSFSHVSSTTTTCAVCQPPCVFAGVRVVFAGVRVIAMHRCQMGRMAVRSNIGEWSFFI